MTKKERVLAVGKYRKKPVVIEAVQWNGGNFDEVKKFYKDALIEYPSYNMKIRIKTLEGITMADCGDFIIKGVKGEFYACKPDIFEATYEKVNSDEEI